jgi:tRNA(Ile2) C34 agmatinyltransferase TiaS
MTHKREQSLQASSIVGLIAGSTAKILGEITYRPDLINLSPYIPHNLRDSAVILTLSTLLAADLYLQNTAEKFGEKRSFKSKLALYVATAAGYYVANRVGRQIGYGW